MQRTGENEVFSIRKRNSRLLLAMLAGSALVPPTYAQAQDMTQTAEEDDSAIVVTAQRRAQRAIDVPIAITAVTGEEIEARNIVQLRDMQYAIPGLVLAESGRGAERASLRGVSQFSGTPTIGTYLDEVSLSPGFQNATFNTQLIDIERVEVLRGPQPTLYGEGSMGGTIRYITAAPDLNNLSVRVAGEVGDINDGGTYYRGDAVVNLPLVNDMLGVRLVGGYENRGGWIDGPNRTDANESRTLTLRGRVLFEPTSQLSISVLGLHQEFDLDDSNFEFANRTTNAAVASPSVNNLEIANAIVQYDFGGATLLSSTGYIDSESPSFSDSTSGFIGQIRPRLPAGTPANFITFVGITSNATFRRWSQEVRLSSNGDNRLDWLVGATYSDDRSASVSVATTAPNPAPFVVLDQSVTDTSKNWTIYGSLNFEITDHLEVGVGARYFRDRRTFDRDVTQFGVAQIQITEGTYDTINPRVDITYKTAHGIVYASAAKGFRSGGFNVLAGAFPIPPAFGPERLWSYEVGTKQQLLDRRLTVELAIYYQDYSNVQIGGVTPAFTLFNTSEGAASGWGADLALSMRPSDNLTISATASYNNLEVTRANVASNVGDPFPLVPTYTASAAVDYERPLTDNVILRAHADIGFTSKSFVIVRLLERFGFPSTQRSGSSVPVNARLGVDFGRFEAFLFGQNLTDDRSVTVPPIGTLTVPIRRRPRTLGIGLVGEF